MVLLGRRGLIPPAPPPIVIPLVYLDEVLADAPLWYGRLGEPSGTNAADASATNADGTYTNTPTLGVAGALIGDADTAVTFTGASSEDVQVAANGAFDIGTSDYSIEFWAKFTSRSVMFLFEYNTGSAGIEAWWNGDHFDARPPGSGGLECTSGGASGLYADGLWHHCVFVADRSANSQWYVDGAASGTPVNISSTSANSIGGVGPLYLARRPAGTYFTGTLDEVAYYGQLLTPERIIVHRHAAGYF